MPDSRPLEAAQSSPELSRRDVIRLLTGAVALPILSSNALAMLHSVHEQMPATADATRKTLSAHQDATVTSIAEWIIPQTDSPGAKAVRVNEFIDLLLTEWYAPEERDAFLKALDNADAQCQTTFGAKFLDCTPTQQKLMLTSWDDQLTEMREAITPFVGENRYRPKPVETNFFRAMKHLTLIGFFTSEAGAALTHYEVVPTKHGACVLIEPAPAASAEAAK